MIFNILLLFAKQVPSLLLAKLPVFLTQASFPFPSFPKESLGMGSLKLVSNSRVLAHPWLINNNGSLSSFLANFSFIILFLAMALYWIDLAFFDGSKKQKQPVGFPFPKLSFGKLGNGKVNAFPSVVGRIAQEPLRIATKRQNQTEQSSSLPFPSFPRESLGKVKKPPIISGFFKVVTLAKNSILLANISLISLLCVRWQESGHFPLSNLYESLMFLSWSCTSILLFLLSVQKTACRERQDAHQVFLEKILGSVLAPCALFLNAFATFSLPTEMQQAGPLVPALQSNWLMMHVTVMIISYAALILGSLLSIAFLIYQAAALPLSSLIPPLSLGAPEGKDEVGERETVKDNNFLSNNLDFLSYRIIGIGFPFLTIGILSGAVWANEAWGSYWSWDPKETWALLTWLVFAIYLHTRITKGWEGQKPAIIASVGFIVVWVCYLGVNLLGEGLHSYGFLST